MRRFLCSFLVTSVAVCMVQADVAAQADDAKDTQWSPARKRVFLGNLNAVPFGGQPGAPDMVDINDLLDLRDNWNNADDVYSPPNPSGFGIGVDILLDMRDNWAKPMPGVYEALGYENRGTFTSLGTGEKKANLEGVLEIGRGLTYDETTRTDVVPADIIYNRIEDSHGGRLLRQIASNDLAKVFYNENAGDDLGYVRGLHSAPNEFRAVQKVVSSYADELDMLGVDVTVEAKYALYSGGLQTSIDTTFHSSTRKFKYIVQLFKDFGWWELVVNGPDDGVPADHVTDADGDGIIDLKPGAIDALRAPGTAWEAWGTHYIKAEHWASELYVTLEIYSSESTSSTAIDSAAHFNFDNGAASVDIASQINSFVKNTNGITSVDLKIEARGGFPRNDPDNPPPPPLFHTIGKDGATGSQAAAINDFVNNWNAQSNSSETAVPIEFWIRPITDFLSDAPTESPFDREFQLRSWLLTFAHFTFQKEKIQEVVDFSGIPFGGNPVFHQGFRHLKNVIDQDELDTALQLLGLPAGSGWLQYYVQLHENVTDARERLLMDGRKLYSDEFDPLDPDAFFDPAANENILPTIRYPTIGIVETRFDQNICGPDDRPMGATLELVGGDFTRNYGFQFIDRNNLFYYLSTGPVTYDSGRDVTIVNVTGNAAGQVQSEESCSRRLGMGVRIVDTSPLADNQIVRSWDTWVKRIEHECSPAVLCP